MTPAPAPTAFRVRPARRGDAAPFVTLLAEVGQRADKATVDWVLGHPEMEILVATDPLDRPIGLITLSPRPILKLGGRAAVIDELVVTQSWRRKGVGRELLRRVVERAKVLSVKRLEAQSLDVPGDALIAFFKAGGFTRADVGVFRLD